MRRSILTQKNWAIFLLYFAANIILIIVLVLIWGILGTSVFELERMIMFFLTIPLVLSYPFLVERRLREILKDHQKFNAITSGKLAVIAGVFFTSYLMTPLLDIFGFLSVLSFLILFSIPAKQLKSIELKRNAGFWEYIADTFQFVFWPLGVWWLQPRLNRIARKKIIIES